MKKTITLALVTICLLVTSFNAEAQKKKYAKDGAGSATAAQPYVGTDIIKVANPQNPKLAQIKGSIKIENENNFDFGTTNSSDKLVVCEVEYTETTSGGITMSGYKLKKILDLNANMVFTKVNNQLYTFTIYNVPLINNYVIAITTNTSVYRSTPSEEWQKYDLVGAQFIDGLANITLNASNADCNTAGSVTTKEIVIKKKQVVN